MSTATDSGPPLRFAAWTAGMKQSALREIHALLSRPGLLSFALGMPARELFPVEAYARTSAHVLATEPDALQYALPLRRLREHIVRLMALRGVTCTADQVFVTNGAQQAMSLLAQLFVSPGDAVVTEALTYDGMLGALRPLAPRVRTVPTCPREGLDVDALADLLRRGERPSLIYTIPEGHNPRGTSLPAEARARLAALAREHGVPVIEDDAYGHLAYDGPAPAALRAHDDRWVLHVGSFSKIFAPGLRIGWVVAHEEIVAKLSILKQGNDLDLSNLAQRTLLAHLDREPIEAHLAGLRAAYAARRDAMLAALGRYLPRARWTRPRAGLFVWVEMPDGVDTTELLRRAVEEAGVAFIPGRAFCAEGGVHGRSALRLNFSCVTPERIEEGIARLGAVADRRVVVSLPASLARAPEELAAG